MLRQVQRHTIAAAASVILLTVALYPLTRQGLLGDLFPVDTPLRSAALAAFALTFGLFLPAAFFFDWLANRGALHPALAPVVLGLVFAAFWIGVQLTQRQFAAWFILFYLAWGAPIAVGFCAYWVPLRFLRRKMPA
jgi:hypothetical protein